MIIHRNNKKHQQKRHLVWTLFVLFAFSLPAVSAQHHDSQHSKVQQASDKKISDESHIDELLENVNSLLKLEEYDRAYALQLRANRLRPNDNDILSVLGYIAMQRYDYAEAAKHFKQALAVDNTDMYSSYYLGKAYNEDGKQDYAIDAFNNHLQRKPDDANAYAERSRAYASIMYYSKALTDINKAISLDNNQRDYFATRAYIYININKHKAAIKDLTKVLQYRKDSHHHYLRARSYGKLKKYRLAVKDMDVVITNEPNEKEHYLKRAEFLIQLNHHTSALADLNHIFEWDAMDPDTHVYLASYFQSRNKNQAALPLYNKAISIDPDTSRYVFYKAVLYCQMKRYDACLSMLDKAYAMPDGNWDEYQLYKSRVLLHLKRYSESLDVINHTIETGYINPLFYRHRADIYRALQDHENAKVDEAYALKLETEGISQTLAGALRQKFDQYEDETYDFRKTLLLSPELVKLE